ncbi:unnamed protein product [Parascedosporium putredinis]|uniref:C2H2 type master regulator of conidiophore development brlA n=1 Tax=Parascedosporium putredinis TaxID=1442378 RepID=A0A9P1MAV5_9PEZI|nr:unnamed protein product [Parascedosporium putredinis]CAI7994813.1 unnamed protein product [Parascedosporium putredinis]
MSGGRPAGGHRRGLSLDTRRQHMRQRSTASAAAAAAALATSSPSAPGQDFTTHHVLREAQQQCLQAGPGTQYAYMSGTTQQQPATAPPTTMSHEAFLMAATHNDPQAQRFDPNCFDPNAIPFDQYLIMQKNRANFEQSMAAAAAANNELFSGNSALSTPTYVEFHETPAQAQGWTSEGEVGTVRRTARRISNGIMDRVAKFEHLTEEIQRPSTPPAQNVNDCHPQPQIKTEAPGQVTCDESRLNRFSEGYDESMEETIKPTRRSGQRKQPTAFDEMRRQAEQQEHQIQAQQAQQPQLQRIAPAGPVPQRANTMPAAYQGIGGHDFMDMNNFSHEFMKIRHGYDGMDFGVVDGMPHINQPHPFDNLPDLRPHDSISQPNSPSRSGASNRASPHRRTESLASIASAASIAGINIEETRTETGITVDDIATYISGPDAVDNKWLCLFEGCGKRFGRKENIKSHVQTHLNDRQYQCPTCNKCFVRQHDLKRHAKIHTGIKPYPCECGNSFARHDALTRHRQRGMCIGAFDGIVRKVVKRGRPRKHRPDMESRMDKASRSRRKNNLSISSVSSSQSGYSDSSSMPGSPHNEYDMLDDDGFDLMDVAIDSSTINGVPPMLGGTSSSQMTAMPADISDLQQYANSPKATTPTCPRGHHGSPQTLPPHPTSPAKSIASQYNEPPELSQSSSPPPSRLFDVEPNTSITDESNLSAFVPIASTNQTLPGSLTVGMGDQEDEMLLKAFTNDERMLHLDRDSSMFMMSKFDEEYAVSMLNAESDMFFGS